MATQNNTKRPLGFPRVVQGDCLDLIPTLSDESIDVVVTSPPYWGQRESLGGGTETDPRDYIEFLTQVFTLLLPKLKQRGIIWLNIGDSYNTPINWGGKDYVYSSLGADGKGFDATNAAYVKPRFKRRAFIDDITPWLKYGNLLMLPQRLLIRLVDAGYLYRGEVLWSKKNAMPEGRCRRPHRKHEPVFLLVRDEQHKFRTAPPVPSVWHFANESISGLQHRSRFPTELPKRCIDAYGSLSPDTLVVDPFAGSGSTGLAALQLGCQFIGFEIDPAHVDAANERLIQTSSQVSIQCDQSKQEQRGSGTL